VHPDNANKISEHIFRKMIFNKERMLVSVLALVYYRHSKYSQLIGGMNRHVVSVYYQYCCVSVYSMSK
jgi:hypothetical protein